MSARYVTDGLIPSSSKHPVMPVHFREYRDAAGRIIEVAENNRARGACGGAGRLDLAVRDWPAFNFGFLFCVLNALNAEGAFFHDTARTYGYFRVVSQNLRFLFHRRVVEEIKAPDFERTVVRAVPRSDAAVVCHLIQAVRAMRRRVDGTHDFAGSVITMLAKHGLMEHRWILQVSFIIPVNPHPMHVPARQHAFGSHYGDVVFRLACNDAGAASDARR